jgi:hypothetical protein
MIQHSLITRNKLRTKEKQPHNKQENTQKQQHTSNNTIISHSKSEKANTEANSSDDSSISSIDHDTEYSSEPYDLHGRQQKCLLTKKWEKFFEKTKAKSIHKNETKCARQHQKNLSQSKIINTNGYHENNLPWGDDMHYEGIVFHNINGIKDTHNWSQILMTMKEMNASCIGFAEINKSMKGFRYQRWNDVTRKIFRVSRMVQSESDIITDTEYKPGGTLTAVVDKWQARITEAGTDERGLGRWSYVITEQQ